MICPRCPAGKEMDIVRTEFAVVGDTSVESETKLFNVPYLTCNNPDCPAHGQEFMGDPIPLVLNKLK